MKRLGQELRLIVAAPGSAGGRYPAGNTGRAAAGLTSMAVPVDLAAASPVDNWCPFDARVSRAVMTDG
ncbi:MULTISPECIES: DUF3703 domain-containing protein [Mycolicibacterium]|uniref:DUF3703 domain-containing protein n=1 Tax=Mycolicibacterium TaxID=1866885 RepID=UPI0038B391B8